MTKTQTRIYLDNAAATPLDDEVRRVMNRLSKVNFGNASSIHHEGVTARDILIDARKRVALIIGARAEEVIFTSGGTEGNNIATRGVMEAVMDSYPSKKIHIVASKIEHPSVRETLISWERRFPSRVSVSWLSVGRRGIVDPKELERTLRSETVLVTVIYANNEIGTIQPIGQLAKIIKKWRLRHYLKEKDNGAGNTWPYFHTDACQAPRALPVKVAGLGVDLMTLNSGKVYGPKGVGCLFRRRRGYLLPLFAGGGQEAGVRSGTENIIGIAGFALALERAAAGRQSESGRLAEFRDRFIKNVLESIPGATLNGDSRFRLPSNANFSFAGISSEELVIELDARGVSASSGSACSSPHGDESYVIMALGGDRSYAKSAVRFSFGGDTNWPKLVYTVKALVAAVGKLRSGQLNNQNPLR